LTLSLSLPIQAIGVKLAVITPSRGFAIELGAAIVIIVGSYLGLPLSTTHCQVGATTGVALLEGTKGINKFVLGKTAFGWIITLIVAGIGAGLIVAQGVHAPLAGSIDAPNSPQAIFLQRTCPQYLNMQRSDDLFYVNSTLYPSIAWCNDAPRQALCNMEGLEC